MTRLTRRAALSAGLATVLASAGRSTRAADIVLDDASRLNATPVARHIVLRRPGEADLVARLRRELRDAATAGRPVAMGAARHSMGGQSLARTGHVVTFVGGACEVDRAAGTFRAGPGTTWREVIATLDPLRLSPAVMQSNHDFGVASTMSVNAHGWPVPHGPFAETVRRVRLMLANGEIVACSRDENAEIFRLVAGGYGLFGVILEIEAAAVPNRLLRPDIAILPAEEFGRAFPALSRSPDVAMAYGRLDVSAGNFLREALMVGWRPAGTSDAPLPPPSEGGFITALSRSLYRSQTGSEGGKRFRWWVETSAAPRLAASAATRNRLLNEPVANLAGRNDRLTDILHEYFIPAEQFGAFLAACREVILPSGQDLLNVTLRHVEADRSSLLAYAPTSRIAAVMSFAQRRDAAADAAMRRMTQALVDRVLAIGGSFYLPYRLHATREQVLRAYPGIETFVAAKRRLDPGLLFRNALWDAWMS